MVNRNEKFAAWIRGKPAAHARSGKLTPVIPNFPDMVSSLYDLQAKTKACK